MAWPPRAICLTSHLQLVPPCPADASHSPEHDQTQPRRKISSQRVEINVARRAQACTRTRQCAHGEHPGTPRASAARSPRVTSAHNLCASRRTTPPCTSWTWPLARGNATGDDCIGDRPPRCCPLPSSSPSHQTTVCYSKDSVMIAWTSPTIRAHPLPLRRPGTTTPSTTCQLRHGHLSPL